MADQFLNASEHQRHDAGDEHPDGDARYREGCSRGGRRQQHHGGRLHQQRHAQRHREADPIGHPSGQQRSDQRAEPEQGPITRADIDASSQSTRHEIDQEDHVRHGPGGIEGVDGEQGEQHPAHGCGGHRRLPTARRRGSCLRPAVPRDRRQQQREQPEADPGRREARTQQQRHQRPRKRDAETDSGEYHAAREAAPCGRRAGDRRRCAERHQHPARPAGGKAPDEKPGEGGGNGAGEEGGGGGEQGNAQNEGQRHAPRQPAGGQRTGEISREVRGAEIGGVGRAEPPLVDQRRDQRRVGEAAQPDTDQNGAKARNHRPPHAA